MERSNNSLAILILFLLVSVYLFPFYPSAETKRELTDWATAVSLVEHNTFDVSKVAKEVGPEKPEDTVSIGESVVSTRAPGFAFLSAPFYAVTRLILGDPSKENQRTSWYVLRLLLSTAPLLLLGAWLYGKEVDSYSLAILFFATPLLGYATLLYPHVLVAVLVYLAYRMLFDSRETSPETCMSGAFLLGAGLLMDYLVIIPIVLFFLGTFGMESRERSRRFIFYFAGLVPAIIFLGIYSFFVLGSPVEFVRYIQIGVPSLTSIYNSFVSPSHGVFVFAPILILGFLGIFTSNESSTRRNAVKGWTVIIYIILASGTAASYGSDSVGPRHMIMVVPLLLDAFFDGDIEEYPSHWRGLMLVVSIAFCAIPMLTYPFVSPELQFPHNSFWGPLLLDSTFYGTTIANTFDVATSHWTILPVLVAIVLVLFLVWKDSKYPAKFGLGLLVGVGVVAAYLLAYPFEVKTGLEKRQEIVERLKNQD